MLKRLAQVGCAIVTIACAGCATSPRSTAPVAPPSAPQSSPPPRAAPPQVNLSGFPPEFKRGYADGCGSARSLSTRRDEKSFRADAQYAAGWNDGYSACRTRAQ